MSQYANLLQTRSGTRLPAELCLRVVELAVEKDPKSIKHYLNLSNSFNTLLMTFEVSIIKTVAGSKQNLHYELLPSCIQPELVGNVTPCSFRWLSELRSRVAATQYLLHHEGITTLSPLLNSLLRPAGIQLLYELADCTAGLKTGRQLNFLIELRPLELAILGVTSKGLTLAWGEHVQRNQTQNESEKRERVCVFENKLLRYGPFFALASFGTVGDLELAWTNDVIEYGLVELEEFETGQRSTIAPSLQSKLWRNFSDKMGCTMEESWPIAMRLLGN